IDGAAGTLSEMAIAWFSDRPIASVVSSGGWAEQLAGKKIDHRRRDTVYAAENPEDAVRYIVRAIRRED
ncbi:MAG: TIGR00725 family protein, partial [Candidatus Thorarchaeota archaeon]